MAEITLYSARICPFCQRSRLALREKGVDFELVEVALGEKPDWFSGLSPFGTVPALRHGEVRIWESAVINEYLEEVCPVPRLLPEDPARRAWARIWVDFAGSRLVPAFYALLTEQDDERRPRRREQLLAVLRALDGEGLGRYQKDGPYWLGAAVSLADLALYPWFERWPVLEHFRKLAFPAELERLGRWREAMAGRRATREDRERPEFYLAGYRDYAEGRRQVRTA